jgi:hypothetical protein
MTEDYNVMINSKELIGTTEYCTDRVKIYITIIKIIFTFCYINTFVL